MEEADTSSKWVTTTHLRRAQFTIRSLMIAVVILAGLLALPDDWSV